MTNEEAITTLKDLKNYYNDKSEYCEDGYVGFDNEDNKAIDMAIKALEQQPCKNCIDKEALINELKLGYFNKELQEAKNDPCVIDAMIDWAIRAVKRQPSVTPKTSCESCREQVLKHLEKEDWADTVNCVMNMPFINKSCVSEGVCREDKMQVLDKIRAEIEALEEGITSYHNDRPCIFKDEVLQIIDKYRKGEEE